MLNVCSYAGGTSSDVGSHSSHPYSQPSPPAIPPANSPEVQPCSTEYKLQPNGCTPNGSLPKLCSTFSAQIEPIMGSGQSRKSPEGMATSSNGIPQTQHSVEDGPLADKGRAPNTQTPSPKEVKVETGKPPKPTGPTNQEKLMLAQMPCVSVTGNGPNGKTITGFLYRYTKAEVSIVCVCHGASFSPAGFVEHAGGVDVEHPLRHIRVVPFALGWCIVSDSFPGFVSNFWSTWEPANLGRDFRGDDSGRTHFPSPFLFRRMTMTMTIKGSEFFDCGS